jgi:hypothetical protein
VTGKKKLTRRRINSSLSKHKMQYHVLEEYITEVGRERNPKIRMLFFSVRK